MSLLRKKSWWQLILGSRLTLLILLLAAVGLSFAVYDRYTVEREMMSRRAESERELRALAERKESLKSRVEYLNNEQGMEAEIRRHFDVAKEGEQVVILLGERERAAAPASSTPKSDPGQRWWNPFSW